jgi:hypothetical protein
MDDKETKKNGANLTDLIDIYCKQVRSILEFAVPVWNNAITKEEISDIERAQKTVLQIALGKDYISYREALNKTEMETLEVRRTQLCKKFAIKAAKHPQTQGLVQCQPSQTQYKKCKHNLQGTPV